MAPLPIDAYAQPAVHASTTSAPRGDAVKATRKKLVAKGTRLRQTSKVVVKTVALQQDLIALKEAIKSLCARETNRAETPPEE